MLKGVHKRYISIVTHKPVKSLKSSAHFKNFTGNTKVQGHRMISTHVTFKPTVHTKESFTSLTRSPKSGYHVGTKKSHYVASKRRYVGRRTARRSRR